jgi:hypothetical protein
MSTVSTQVKIVAWLHVLLGVLGLFIAIVVGIVFGLFGGLLAGAGTGSQAAGIVAFFGVGTVVFILVGVFAIPNLAVAWGLLHGAEWARIVGIIVSIISLVHPAFGLGTAIAIYSLIVLFSTDMVEAYRRSPG